MFVSDLSKRKKRVLSIISKDAAGKRGSLLPVVRSALDLRKDILALTQKYPTPFYVLDERALREKAREFRLSFEGIPASHYYAVKANHHPHILRTVVEEGFGLDVSSGREFKLALAANAKRIIFSGPGKTLEDLAMALDYADRVIVHIDSFSELKKLGDLAKEKQCRIRAGVRVFTPLHGSWSKFGIPLKEWPRFWREAKKYEFLSLEGVQSHMSWNTDPKRYVALLKEFASVLKAASPEMRNSIRFIDLGGGFYPHRAEGYYPWTAHYPGTPPTGKILKIVDSYFNEDTPFAHKYYITESVPLKRFGDAIRQTIKKELAPLLSCEYFTEPGRVLCTTAMHIVLRVLDRKDDHHLIMDGGVNMVGWEYGEFFYNPIVNLSQPSLKEHSVTLFGPLCTPHDIWGYYCYGKKLTEGDIVLVTNQGAYRYGLAQSFIKPLPAVHSLA